MIDLAAEFPTPTREQWMERVAAVLLRGRPDAGPEALAEAFTTRLVHRTEDDIEIQPLYTRPADGEPDPADGAGHPGAAPFVRGLQAVPMAWEVRQRVWDSVEGSSAVEELESGATGLLLELAGEVDVAALDRVLDGVLLDVAPVSLSTGDRAAAETAARSLLALWDDRGIEADARRGTLGLDPIGAYARSGGASDRAEGIAAACALAVEVDTVAPHAHTLVVDGTVWHDAGATAAQELGWATATGVEYLRALTDRGLPVSRALGALEFRWAATADQFGTIAKLRAARRIWARVAEVAGAPPEARGQHQHAVSARTMMTRYDPWVNVLRSTVACFAAGVGGAAAVTVEPHDALVTPGGSRHGRRLARNTQSILLMESHLARVADVAGGSWYVDRATEELAGRAWERVQRQEREGGVAAALNSGAIHTELASAVDRRRRLLATRRRPLTGLSEYPDITEPPPPAVEVDGESGAASPPGGMPFPPLGLRRLSEDFERQRRRADRHLAATGERPRVHLATLGSPAAHTPRLTYARNLFHVGGIETSDGPVDEVAPGVSAACICGADDDVRGSGAEAAAALRAAGVRRVLVAGRGLDVDGVDEEVGVGSDVLDVLTRTLDHLLDQTEVAS